MFHLIYTRSNTEYYKGDVFESNYTLYRNIPYSELSKFLEMQKDPELLKECDTKYFEHQRERTVLPILVFILKFLLLMMKNILKHTNMFIVVVTTALLD